MSKKKKQGRPVHGNKYANLSQAPKIPGDIKITQQPETQPEGQETVDYGTHLGNRNNRKPRRNSEYDRQAGQRSLNAVYGKGKVPDLFQKPGSDLEQNAQNAPEYWGNGIIDLGGVKFDTERDENGIGYAEARALLPQIRKAVESSIQRSSHQHVLVKFNQESYFVEIGGTGVVHRAMVYGEDRRLQYANTSDPLKVRGYKTAIKEPRRFLR